MVLAVGKKSGEGARLNSKKADFLHSANILQEEQPVSTEHPRLRTF